MIKTQNSNYSIFLLALLFIEFISYFLRANSLPNLGIYVRMAILAFIIANFLLRMFVDLINGNFSSRLYIRAVVFWLYSLLVYFLSMKNISFVSSINLTTWVAVLYLFYYYGFPKSGKLLNFVVGVFTAVFIPLYYRFALHNGFVGNKPGVVNAVYYLVMIIPFLLLFNNKFLKILFITVISLISIQSSKTTAILMILFSILICFVFSGGAKRKNFLMFLEGLIAFFALLLLLIKFTDLNINHIVFANMEDGGNGRLYIWKSIFTEYNNGSLVQKLFGYSMNFSVSVTGFSAHCDFFEIITSFGIIGFLIFFSWFIFTAKKIVFHMRNQKYYYIALVVLLQMLLIFLFSTSIFVSNYFLLLSAFIGMLFNNYENQDNISDTTEEAEL